MNQSINNYAGSYYESVGDSFLKAGSCDLAATAYITAKGHLGCNFNADDYQRIERKLIAALAKKHKKEEDEND